MILIAAVDSSWGIGYENDLLFHIPEDMKFFRSMTLNKTVVMGKATLDSLPGGNPLKNRDTVVLSTTMKERDDLIICRSLDELLGLLEEKEDVMVCGGESIYKLLLPYSDKAYITKIQSEKKADKFFPNLDALPDWKLTEESEEKEHEGIKFSFCTYERI